jgi:diguanylate cyclase (GGDEF)-like protein
MPDRPVRLVFLCLLSLTALAVTSIVFVAPTAGGPSAILLCAGAIVVAGLVVTGMSLRRIRTVIALMERLQTGDHVSIERPSHGLTGRLERAFNGVSAHLRETHDAATTDRLTQVSNRGTLLSSLFHEIERAVRHQRPLSVAFVDLDHFKEVNDTYGHGVGDEVLREVALLFRENIRLTDVIGRYGGEEFMLILPESTPEEAAEVAEKLRLLVQRREFKVDGPTPLRVTISVGVAGGQGMTLRPETLIQWADQAMYSAKSLGRNQTYVFREPDEDARVVGAPISRAGRVRALEVAAVARRATEIALTEVVDPLPHYRGKPSSLIATIAVAIATDLGLPTAEIERVRVASLLHDIGKIAIPEQILEKPAPLDDAEWSFVRQHPRIGQLILDESGGMREAGKIILHHHERFSGHGYPHGLRGREIPLGSRIVSIADAYDAMVRDRPYKTAVSHEHALGELRRCTGTQFDPELIDLFLARYADVAPIPDAGLLTVPDATPAARPRTRARKVIPA